MSFAVDIGNTYCKLGLFEGSELRVFHAALTPEALEEQLAGLPPMPGIVCNVGQAHGPVLYRIGRRHALQYFGRETPLPIRNGYATPETLGLDRLAAVVGAYSIFPGQACLVVDLGTCITYDFLTADGVYMGGGISPGMGMRLRAMHEQTARLPLLDRPMELPALVGDSTHSCMQSGVVWGIKCELEGILSAYGELFGNFQVLFCGGDAIFFESIVNHFIFVNHSLVLLGLRRVLHTHVE